MKKAIGAYFAILGLLTSAAAIADLAAQQSIPHPRDVFGFELGADYKLAKYDQIEAYFERLDAASDRVKVVRIGESVLGRSLLLAFISSEENIRQLDEYRDISERLARGRDLTDVQARQLAKEGKAIVWIDAGIHATEVAPVQSTPLLAHKVVTEETEEMRRIREDVILLLMPVMNPDGMDMVAEWYESNLGTRYETAPLPGLYHFYTGHDNNRDWAMHTQKESQAVAPVLYEEWYPQILYIQHQTGPFPARIHMPPFDDPVNPNIHPLVVQSVNVIGAHMAKRFGEERKPGAIQHRQYPMWRADGLRYAVYGHNIMGVHTETQLFRYATPRYYDPDSLPGVFGGRGAPLSTTNPSVFYPDPWRGGWWRLGDAVEYVLTACMGVLDIAERLKEDWLYNSYTMARDAIQKEGDVFAWVIPLEQWDRSEAIELVRILRRAGVEVHRAISPFLVGDKSYGAGSYLAYGGQAFRGFIAHILDKQAYPDRRLYSGGPPIPPYDLAGWTFPVAMGVNVDRVERRQGIRCRGAVRCLWRMAVRIAPVQLSLSRDAVPRSLLRLWPGSWDSSLLDSVNNPPPLSFACIRLVLGCTSHGSQTWMKVGPGGSWRKSTVSRLTLSMTRTYEPVICRDMMRSYCRIKVLGRLLMATRLALCLPST
jgi:hypothetical protein